MAVERKPIEIGINADAKYLGNTGSFMDFARECGSVTVIDDREWKLLPELRAQNPTQKLSCRYHYKGAEGLWRDIIHDGKPQTPQRMFEVLTAGYRSEVDVWVYFGNEPARGKGDTLKADIEFYCAVVMLFVQNKAKVVVQNIQIPELTPENILLFKPLFELCHKYPQYVAFGIHQYFTLLLSLGAGSGDWTKLLKWGSHPKSAWATRDNLVVNAVNAHMGRDVWLRQQLNNWGYTNVRLFNTECGFDRINNLPQIHALDNANGGRPVRGIQSILELLKKHEPDKDPLVFAAENVTWMGDALVEGETLDFYNWSIEPEWQDYSCDPDNYGLFRQAIVAYNRKVRAANSTPPTQPPTQQPPTIPTWRDAFTDGEQAVIDAAFEYDPDGMIGKMAKAIRWNIP